MLRLAPFVLLAALSCQPSEEARAPEPVHSPSAAQPDEGSAPQANSEVDPEPATAEDVPPEPTAAPAAAAPEPRGVTVTKAQWIDGMRSELPPAFCKAGTFFRECFRMGEPQCLATARRHTQSCLAKLASAMPDTFHQPRDGQAWGFKVGECAGEAFETSNLSRRKPEARCKDPSAW